MNYELLVSSDALRKAIDHSFQSLDSSPPVEKGGFLIGHKYDAERKVMIKDSCNAPFALSAPTYMKISHDDWEFADRHLKKFHGGSLGCNILGWYHSHPGYEVFISSRDRFIIENFFDKPWNVSLVVDPINRSFGFFTWSKNEAHPVQSFSLLPDLKYRRDLKTIDIHIVDRNWRYLRGPSTIYQGRLFPNETLKNQLKGLFFRNIERRVCLQSKGHNERVLKQLRVDLSPSDIGISDGDTIVID